MGDNRSNRSLLHFGLWGPSAEPEMLRPGVAYREADLPGNAYRYAIPPEHPERTAMGDLGFAGLAPPRSLSFGGLPFSNLRKY